MSHAKSLRVIGQSLEAAQVPRFKLTKDAERYQLWIAKYQFCFSPGDIARLEEYESSLNKSRNSRVFTAEELRQLGLRRRLLRSTPYLAQQLNP
jgi:hypothetical protein